jgi:hypothetical protein
MGHGMFHKIVMKSPIAKKPFVDIRKPKSAASAFNVTSLLPDASGAGSH